MKKTERTIKDVHTDLLRLVKETSASGILSILASEIAHNYNTCIAAIIGNIAQLLSEIERAKK